LLINDAIDILGVGFRLETLTVLSRGPSSDAAPRGERAAGVSRGGRNGKPPGYVPVPSQPRNARTESASFSADSP